MKRFLLLGLLATVASAEEPATRWWKGNLHTHTLWSDGDDYPEMVASWYKEHGYQFLGLSDHNIIADHAHWVPLAKNRGGEVAFEKYLTAFGTPWVERRPGENGEEVRLKMLSELVEKLAEPGRFLMVPSEEITGRYLTAPIHINAINVRELIPPQTGNSVVEVMQKTVAAVAAQREKTGVPMFAHINHPNFGWGITAEELLQLDGERFFEVYNGHPKVRNEGDAIHASTDRVWDILLTERLDQLGKEPFWGLGSDDSHNYHHDPAKDSRPGRGWIMVRARELSANALVAAMEAGDFYASSGVTLQDVRRDPKQLRIEIAAEPGVEYTTEFIGTRRGYERANEPVVGSNGAVLRVTRKYSEKLGAVLATQKGPKASYQLQGDEIYVRARITSTKLKSDPYLPGEFERAWTQPLVAPRSASK